MSVWETEKVGRMGPFDLFVYESEKEALKDLQDAYAQLGDISELEFKFEDGILHIKNSKSRIFNKSTKKSSIQFADYGEGKKGILSIKVYDLPTGEVDMGYERIPYTTASMKNLMVSKFLKEKFSKK